MFNKVLFVAMMFGIPILSQNPAPSDYQVYGNIDVVIPTGGQFNSNSSVTLGGWLTECRSGLQPQTQRLGSIFVQWRLHVNGQPDRFYRSDIQYLSTTQRPDVANELYSACPAVGENVGYIMVVSTPTNAPNTTWTMEVHGIAIDSAGRNAEWMDSRQITFVQ